MTVRHRFLFNFAASYTGGGFKRLHEYAKWFNANGGAWFVIHPRCRPLVDELGVNRYFIVNPSRLARLFDDCGYLRPIVQEIGAPDLYYSYGIGLRFPVGRVNWFHLSNVLPLYARGIPLSALDRLKLSVLGWKFRAGLVNADVISAESEYSVGLVDVPDRSKLFVSVNGSDDELAMLASAPPARRDNNAVVVGTYLYKGLDDSFRVFEMLRAREPGLRLTIIGNPDGVSPALRAHAAVDVRGMLPRAEVVECLRRSRFYISTTHIENSFNAASEGAFLSEESFISDIGPHRELLRGMPSERIQVSGMSRPMLHVKRANLTGANLKSWDTVVTDMIERFRQALR